MTLYPEHRYDDHGQLRPPLWFWPIALLLTRRAAALLSLRFRPSGALRGVVSRQHIISIPTSPTPFGRYRAFLVV